MTEHKPTEAERLRAENEKLSQQLAAADDANENLRGQLAAAGAARQTGQVVREFALSEGDRQELEVYGVVNIDGRQYTTDQVRKELAKNPRYANVEIEDAPDATRREPTSRTELAGVRGIDYVYPSVSPGRIDPAVAGTPGINGPSADSK